MRSSVLLVPVCFLAACSTPEPKSPYARKSPENAPPPHSQPATLAELNEITLRACEPKSAQRYQDAAELRMELTLLQTGKSVRRLRRLERRVAWLSQAGLAAGIVALLALGAYFGSIKQIHRARRAEAQATDRLSRLQRQKAEEFLANDQTGEGLAYLARVVRAQRRRCFRLLDDRADFLADQLGNQLVAIDVDPWSAQSWVNR
jgi:hypothetical protein